MPMLSDVQKGFLTYKDEFLVYLEHNLKKGLAPNNKGLPSNITDILKELDNAFLTYAKLPKDGMKPHIFETLYENKLYNRKYDPGTIRLSHLQYEDISRSFANMGIDDVKLLLEKIGDDVTKNELVIALRQVVKHLSDGKDPDSLEFSEAEISPQRVENLINDMRSLDKETRDSETKQALKKILNQTNEHSEEEIYNALPSFLHLVSNNKIPLVAPNGNEFIKKHYTQCFNASSRVLNNIQVVDKEFLDFLNERYYERTGVRINAGDLKSFIKETRDSTNSLVGFLREDIKNKYGDKTFVTQECIDEYNEYSLLTNQGVEIRSFEDILDQGSGRSFLDYIKEEPNVKGVWDLKYGARDLFIGADSPSVPPRVETLREDEILRDYNSTLLNESLGEDLVKSQLATLYDFNRGIVDINLFGKEVNNFDLDKFLDNFEFDAMGSAKNEYGERKMEEFLDYFVKETNISEEELNDALSNSKLNPNPIEKMVIHAASYRKLKEEEKEIEKRDVAKRIASGKEPTLTERNKENKKKTAELERIDKDLQANFNGFGTSFLNIKKNYRDLSYEVKNVLTGGYSLGNSNLHTSYLSNVSAGLGLMGVTKDYSDALIEDMFRTSTHFSERIAEEVPEVNDKFTRDGYGSVTNYANVEQAATARVYRDIRNIMGGIDLEGELSKKEENPYVYVAMNEELPKLEIIARELAYLHSDNPKFNAQTLINTYNELTKNDENIDKISVFELDNKGNPTSRLKSRETFVDKSQLTMDAQGNRTRGRAIDLDNPVLNKIEAVYLSRLASLNVLGRELKSEYPGLIEQINATFVNVKDYVPQEIIDEMGLPEKMSAQTVRDLLISRQQLMFETLGSRSIVEDDLNGANLIKNRLLERTNFLKKRDEAIDQATEFLKEHKKEIERNKDLGEDYFLNIEIPNGMFFKKEELKEIYDQSTQKVEIYSVEDEASKIRELMEPRISRVGFDSEGNFLEAGTTSAWMNLNTSLYKPIFAPLVSKGIVDYEYDNWLNPQSDGSSGENSDGSEGGSKESKGKKESQGITDETVYAEAQSRLENNPDRDNPEVIERVKNEVKRDFEELVALERLREQIRKEVEKIKSEEVKSISDDFKEDAIQQADKAFQDILSEIAFKYNLTEKDVIDNLGGKIIDTSNLDEGTIAEIKNITKELGIFDEEVKDGRRILLTKEYLEDEYLKTAIIDSINNNFDNGIVADAINAQRKDEGVPLDTGIQEKISIIDKSYEEKVKENLTTLFNREERNDVFGRFNNFYENERERENYAGQIADINMKINEYSATLSDIDDYFTKDLELTEAVKRINDSKEMAKCPEIYEKLEKLCPVVDFSRMDLDEVKNFMQTAKHVIEPKTAVDPNTGKEVIIDDPLKRLTELNTNESLNNSVRTISYDKDFLNAKSLAELERLIAKNSKSDKNKVLQDTGYREELAKRLLVALLPIANVMGSDQLSKGYKGIKSAKDIVSPIAWIYTFKETFKCIYNISLLIKYNKDCYFPSENNRLKDQAEKGGLFIPNDLAQKHLKEIDKIANKGLELGVLSLDQIPADTKNPYFKEIRDMNKNVFVRTFEEKDGVAMHRDKSAYTRENLMINIEQNVKKIEQRLEQVTNNPNINEDDKNKILAAYEKTRLVQASFYVALSQKDFGVVGKTLSKLPGTAVSDMVLEKLEKDVYSKFNDKIIDIKKSLEVERALSRLNMPEIIKNREIIEVDKNPDFDKMANFTAEIIEKFGFNEIDIDPKTINEVRAIVKKNLGEDSPVLKADGGIDFVELAKLADKHLESVQTVTKSAKDRILSAVSGARDPELDVLAKDPVLADKINEKKFVQLDQYAYYNGNTAKSVIDFAVKAMAVSGTADSIGNVADLVAKSGFRDQGALMQALRAAKIKKEGEENTLAVQKASSLRKRREDDIAAGITPL